MSVAKRASYLVTFRDDGRGRAANLRVVAQWAGRLTGVELIVVEQAARSAIPPALLPASARHVLAANAGPFNRSWGFNVAARLARAPVLVVADADLIVPLQALEAAIGACQGGMDAVNPYTSVVDVAPRVTESVHAGGVDRLEALRAGGLDRTARGEHPGFCSGAYVIRRAAYERLGGQDERFEGWGGEDDAMTVKVVTLLDRVIELSGYTAYHLHHARGGGWSVDDALYRRNIELVRAYRAMTREELESACAAQRTDMGDPGRYGSSGWAG